MKHLPHVVSNEADAQYAFGVNLRWTIQDDKGTPGKLIGLVSQSMLLL